MRSYAPDKLWFGRKDARLTDKAATIDASSGWLFRDRIRWEPESAGSQTTAVKEKFLSEALAGSVSTANTQ